AAFLLPVFSPPPPSSSSTLFPYTTLFRSGREELRRQRVGEPRIEGVAQERILAADFRHAQRQRRFARHRRRELLGARRRELIVRSEEHTSELQSPYDLVCRLLLEKKKKTT